MSVSQESPSVKSGPKLAFNTSKASEASEPTAKNAIAEGMQSLADMYLKIAARNYEQQVATISALTSAKTPAEFFELQQTIIRDGIGAAVADGKALAELAATAFGSAFGISNIQMPCFLPRDRQSA